MSAGGPKPSACYVERQLLTRSPTTPATPSGKDSNTTAFNGTLIPTEGAPLAGDGLVLAGLSSIIVSLYPWVGQTLSGSGSLLCWLYNPYMARWTRYDDFDIDLSNTSAYPAFTKGATWDPSRLGFLINWAASAVTVSGGSTDVLIRIDGFISYAPRSA